ncbi:MAG: hypothetical protein ACSLEM_04285 [Candidatus Malihini olakiniferum]
MRDKQQHGVKDDIAALLTHKTEHAAISSCEYLLTKAFRHHAQIARHARKRHVISCNSDCY